MSSQNQSANLSQPELPGFHLPDDVRYQEVLDELDRKFKPWIDTIRASEHLTEDDFRIIVR